MKGWHRKIDWWMFGFGAGTTYSFAIVVFALPVFGKFSVGMFILGNAMGMIFLVCGVVRALEMRDRRRAAAAREKRKQERDDHQQFVSIMSGGGLDYIDGYSHDLLRLNDRREDWDD